MRKIFLAFLLFQKRIVKKPVFIITIILIPLLMIMLAAFSVQKSALVEVAVFSEQNKSDSDSLLKDILESSTQVISFYECGSVKEVKQNVITGKAECGYIIPADIDDFAKWYYTDDKTIDSKDNIKVLLKDSSVTTRVVNEIVLEKIFSRNAYNIAKNFLREKHEQKIQTNGASARFRELYEKNSNKQMMFKFEYADGSDNSLLNDTYNNYYMLPVRGILAVLILMSGLAGVLMLNRDDERGVWGMIRRNRRSSFDFFYIFSSQFLVAVCSFAEIMCTGLAVSFVWELFILMIYSLLVTSFCNILRMIIKNQYTFCSVIPVLILLSLLVCPVFIDLENISGIIGVIRKLLPVSYYLESVHSLRLFVRMIAVTAVLCMLQLFLPIISDKCKFKLTCRC